MKVRALRSAPGDVDATSFAELSALPLVIDCYHAFDELFPGQILRFEKNPTGYVEFSFDRLKGVFLRCTIGNKTLETLVRSNAANPFTPEEFLEDFWNNHLLEKYNFEHEEKPPQQPALTYTAKFGAHVFWPFPVLIVGVLILLLIKRGTQFHWDMFLFVFVCALLMTLPYFLLVLRYFIFNGGATLTVDHAKERLTFSRRGETTSINKNEITGARIIYKTQGRSFYAGFKYLLLDAGPKNRMVITHFLCSPEEFARQLKLKPKMIPSLYPWIRLKIKTDAQLIEEANESETKTQEFMERWSGKSEAELLEIAADKNEYAEYAVEAAHRLLRNKKPSAGQNQS